MTLLERLNDLKEKSGLNAKQLTSTLGISSTSFTDWNKGKGSPSLDAVVKFCNYFDVSLDYLVFGEERKNEMLDISNTKEKAVLSKFKQLPDNLQDKVLSYMDGMLAAIPEKSDDDEKRLSV